MIILRKGFARLQWQGNLIYDNSISPRPTFWKILTLTDFLEQVITIIYLSTWWKHPVKNSQYKNEMFSRWAAWREWILQKHKPQLPVIGRVYLFWSTLKHLSRIMTLTTTFPIEGKHTCHPDIPESPASKTGILRWGLSLLGNIIYQLDPKEGKWLTEESTWTCLMLHRRRTEQNLSSR